VLSAASGNRYCHFSYEEEGEERAVSASAMALSVDTFRPSSVMVRAVRSAQALGLRCGGELPRVGGSQVAQPRAHHLQRLTGRRGYRFHLGHLLAGTGRC
jgi:hypothetical protein